MIDFIAYCYGLKVFNAIYYLRCRMMVRRISFLLCIVPDTDMGLGYKIDYFCFTHKGSADIITDRLPVFCRR